MVHILAFFPAFYLKGHPKTGFETSKKYRLVAEIGKKHTARIGLKTHDFVPFLSAMMKKGTLFGGIPTQKVGEKFGVSSFIYHVGYA